MRDNPEEAYADYQQQQAWGDEQAHLAAEGAAAEAKSNQDAEESYQDCVACKEKIRADKWPESEWAVAMKVKCQACRSQIEAETRQECWEDMVKENCIVHMPTHAEELKRKGGIV